MHFAQLIQSLPTRVSKQESVIEKSSSLNNTFGLEIDYFFSFFVLQATHFLARSYSYQLSRFIQECVTTREKVK